MRRFNSLALSDGKSSSSNAGSLVYDQPRLTKQIGVHCHHPAGKTAVKFELEFCRHRAFAAVKTKMPAITIMPMTVSHSQQTGVHDTLTNNDEKGHPGHFANSFVSRQAQL
jgi:hypothetical protein